MCLLSRSQPCPYETTVLTVKYNIIIIARSIEPLNYKLIINEPSCATLINPCLCYLSLLMTFQVVEWGSLTKQQVKDTNIQ